MPLTNKSATPVLDRSDLEPSFQQPSRRGVLALAGLAGVALIAAPLPADAGVRVTAMAASSDATGLSGGFVTVRGTFVDETACYDVVDVARGYSPGMGRGDFNSGADVSVSVAPIACRGRSGNRVVFRIPHPVFTDILNVAFVENGRTVASQRVQITQRSRFILGG
ncbi:MAG: hypothetical protein AAFX39_03350 [Pseudomonadota bacterium]